MADFFERKIMQVETFECVETASEPIEASEEALSLIESLGLDGQKQLTVASPSGFAARFPYRQITVDEMFAYKSLCPVEVELSRYNNSAIPLRVLQIAAHAKSLNFLHKLCVWDRESAAVKDPVLIGYQKHPQYDWMNGPAFILARWGEELETFPVLLKRAISSVRERLAGEAEKLVLKLKASTDSEILKAGERASILAPWE